MNKKKQFFKYMIFVLIPVLLFYATAFMTYNPFVRTRWRAQLLNIALFELLVWILLGITGSAVIALRIETILALVVSVANYYVLSFRASPIVPWDILSIGTAASVAGGYSYMLPLRQTALILFLLALVCLEHFVKIHIVRQRWKIRLLAGLAGIAGIAGITYMVQQESCAEQLQLYPFLFTPTVMYERNGFAVTFLMDLQYLSVEKPEGYDKETAAALLEEQEGLDWTAAYNRTDSEAVLPNVIVVMDEAFSDLSVLGDFTPSEDPLPFLHQLEQGAENTVTGALHVSVKGGNTANTEFEFLTGDTMAYLPPGSIPYQQYVTEEKPSLASYLKSLGYETYAMHPYYAAGWNRETVYPLLGFDSFLSLPDFQGATYKREYVDDSACVDKIIELYEQKKAGVPSFIFNVTMQNHSPYTDGYSAQDGNILVDGSYTAQLSAYLNLMKETDQAMEKLITYFKNQTEPTVVVYFGDHQPTDSVVEPIWKANGRASRNLSEQDNQKRYEVPYVIWANYDIAEVNGEDTSVNYLAANMMKYAGIPLSGYQNYLLKLEEEIPLISSQHTEGEDSEKWKEYQMLQYYLLFDYHREEES